MSLIEHFQGKRVLITGGLGFIGSNLAKRLCQSGVEVTVIDSLIPEYGGNLRNVEGVKDSLTVNISDVRDEHAMKYLVKGQHCLFSSAGQTSHVDSMTNPFPDLEINCRAQLSILEACRKHNSEIKIVFASTRQIYGKPQYLPVDEKHPQQPVDINGINKMAGEWYHLVFNNVYGIRSTVLRLTNTYGPGMRVKDARQTFLGIWIRNLLEQKPIRVFGDGKQVRDYNYVDDVVDALMMAAASDDANGQIYNLGSKRHMSLLDTAKMMTSLCPGEYELVDFPSDRKNIDIGDFYADYSKINDHLGWEPKIDFKSGMQQTIDYYGRDLAHYLDQG